MEELKALFGDGAISYADFEQKLGEQNIRLIDLNKGGYLAKEKYDKLNADFNKYKLDNDVSKFADYEIIKSERDALKAEKEQLALLDKIAKASVGEKYRKFVLSEVAPLVKEGTTFEKELETYLKDNQQFVERSGGTVFKRMNTQVPMDGGQGQQKTENQRMNEILRGVRK